ncbi:MAG: STAS domain-containing protein [Mariprofundaceae bacterium]
MDQELRIDKERLGEGRWRLRVNGDVTFHTSPRLRETLKPLLTAENRYIQVALDGVDFMDSSGIATLVEGLQWSKAHAGEFVLTGLNAHVRDVFALAKLDSVFDIRDSDPAIS